MRGLSRIAFRAFVALAVLCSGFSGPARANDCAAAYEQEAQAYWPIINDILDYKAVFDSYLALCSKHHPDAIAALQPFAGRLIGQTEQDIKNARRVMAYIVDEELPAKVPLSCSGDLAARSRAKDSLAAQMDKQKKRIDSRLARSGREMDKDGKNLEICLNLSPLEKTARRQLGGDPQNPLFEISYLRHMASPQSRFDPRRTAAYKTYRRALEQTSVANNFHR